MIAAISGAVTNMISWAGEVLDSVVTADGALAALLPVFAIGIAASLLFFGVKVIRSLTWGA